MEAEESRARDYKRGCSRRERSESSSVPVVGSKFYANNFGKLGRCSTRRS